MSVFSSSRPGRLWSGLALRLILLAVSLFTSISAHAQWISSHRVGDTAYFLFAYPSRFERYDLAARSWLPPVSLPSSYGLPTCGWVDQDGIYVTYGGRSVYRHNLSGGDTSHVMNSTGNVVGLITDGNWLFVNRSDNSYARFTSINKTTGVIGTFENYIYSIQGASIAPSLKKIFGRTTGVSPSDLTFVTYDDMGQVVSGGDSPHHGDYPNASKTWVFPSEDRVVDSSGTIYSTVTLQYSGSLGTAVDDIQFPAGSGPVVVSGTAMSAYSDGLLPVGSVTLPFAPSSFYLNGADAVIFGADNTQPNGVRTHAVPLSSLGTPPVTGVVDPTHLAYTPDAVFLANDGTLLLVSNANKSIFRWSPEARQYLATIPLAKKPAFSAYSKATNTVFLADLAGIVRSVDLGAASPVEKPFAILPTPPLGLAVAGDYVFTADSSGAWCTHRTFNAAGVQISAKDWNYYSEEYVWSEAAQKIYHFRDDTSPNDLHWEQVNANGTAYPLLSPGAIGDDRDTPLHGGDQFRHPIRVSPDGSVVVLGSGAIFDANTLSLLPLALPVAVDDIVWHGGKIKTIRTIAGKTRLESWAGPTLALDAFRQLQGQGLRLFSIDGSRLLAVCLPAQGKPIFNLLDGDLEIIPPAVLATPGGLAISSPSAGKLSLQWSDIGGELGYLVQRKPSGSEAWQEIGETGESETGVQFPMLAADDTFDYRVIAFHGTLVSEPSPALENVLSGPPLPPANLALKAKDAATASLRWDDGELEDGYRIEARTPGEAWKAVLFPEEDASSARVSGLESNTVYEFRIAARNPLGISKWVSVTGRTKHGQGEISILGGEENIETTDRETGFDFGFMRVGSRSRGVLRLTIRNLGKLELRKLRVALTGPNPGDFHVTKLTKRKLASGEAVEIEVRFQALRKGRRVAALQVYSSDPNESPFDILLLGRGKSGRVIDKDTEPVSKGAQHFNGLREFARGAGGGEAGEAAAF